METEINIVEILKDKPQGTKLYSSACGKCKLEEVDDKSFKISFYNSKFGFMNGGEGYLDKNGKLYDDGECVVFPSKEMRDWNKFAWQKGDILVNENNAHIIFEKFTDDTYTTFIGRHYLNKNYKNYVPGRYTCVTQHFHIEESNAAQIYIYNIEEKIGGKLDLKTLEIEKPKCEFKTFDKVLGRNEKDDVWEADLFSHYKEESQYPFRCIGFSRKYCIPYNKETAHLLGTTDEWKGGEG
jgi:hypothetical protein